MRRQKPLFSPRAAVLNAHLIAMCITHAQSELSGNTPGSLILGTQHLSGGAENAQHGSRQLAEPGTPTPQLPACAPSLDSSIACLPVPEVTNRKNLRPISKEASVKKNRTRNRPRSHRNLLRQRRTGTRRNSKNTRLRARRAADGGGRNCASAFETVVARYGIANDVLRYVAAPTQGLRTTCSSTCTYDFSSGLRAVYLAQIDENYDSPGDLTNRSIDFSIPVSQLESGTLVCVARPTCVPPPAGTCTAAFNGYADEPVLFKHRRWDFITGASLHRADVEDLLGDQTSECTLANNMRYGTALAQVPALFVSPTDYGSARPGADLTSHVEYFCDVSTRVPASRMPIACDIERTALQHAHRCMASVLKVDSSFSSGVLEGYGIPGAASINNDVDFAYFADTNGTRLPASDYRDMFSTAPTRPTRFANTLDFLTGFYNGRPRDTDKLPRVVAATLLNFLRTSTAYDIYLRGNDYTRSMKDDRPDIQFGNSTVILLDACRGQVSDRATPRYADAGDFERQEKLESDSMAMLVFADASGFHGAQDEIAATEMTVAGRSGKLTLDSLITSELLRETLAKLMPIEEGFQLRSNSVRAEYEDVAGRATDPLPSRHARLMGESGCDLGSSECYPAIANFVHAIHNLVPLDETAPRLQARQTFQLQQEAWIANRTRIPAFDDTWLATRSWPVANASRAFLRALESIDANLDVVEVFVPHPDANGFGLRYTLDVDRILLKARLLRTPQETVSGGFAIAEKLLSLPAWHVLRTLANVAEINKGLSLTELNQGFTTARAALLSDFALQSFHGDRSNSSEFAGERSTCSASANVHAELCSRAVLPAIMNDEGYRFLRPLNLSSCPTVGGVVTLCDAPAANRVSPCGELPAPTTPPTQSTSATSPSPTTVLAVSTMSPSPSPSPLPTEIPESPSSTQVPSPSPLPTEIPESPSSTQVPETLLPTQVPESLMSTAAPIQASTSIGPAAGGIAACVILGGVVALGGYAVHRRRKKKSKRNNPNSLVQEADGAHHDSVAINMDPASLPVENTYEDPELLKELFDNSNIYEDYGVYANPDNLQLDNRLQAPGGNAFEQPAYANAQSSVQSSIPPSADQGAANNLAGLRDSGGEQSLGGYEEIDSLQTVQSDIFDTIAGPHPNQHCQKRYESMDVDDGSRRSKPSGEKKGYSDFDEVLCRYDAEVRVGQAPLDPEQYQISMLESVP